MTPGEGRNLSLSAAEGPGRILRGVRRRAGLTTRDFAEFVGSSESYVWRVEAEKTDPSDAWIRHAAGVIAQHMAENAGRAAV